MPECCKSFIESINALLAIPDMFYWILFNEAFFYYLFESREKIIHGLFSIQRFVFF